MYRERSSDIDRSLAKYDSAKSIEESYFNSKQSRQRNPSSSLTPYKEHRSRQTTYSPEPRSPAAAYNYSERSYSDAEECFKYNYEEDTPESDCLSSCPTLEQEYDEIYDDIKDTRSITPSEDFAFPSLSIIKYSMPKQEPQSGNGSNGSKPVLVSSCTVTIKEPPKLPKCMSKEESHRRRSSSTRYESSSPPYGNDSRVNEDYKCYRHLSKDYSQNYSRHTSYSSRDMSDKQSPYGTYGSACYDEYGYSQRDQDSSESYSRVSNSRPRHRKLDSDEVIKVPKMKLKKEHLQYLSKESSSTTQPYQNSRSMRLKSPISEISSFLGSDCDSVLGSTTEDSSYSDAYIMPQDVFLRSRDGLDEELLQSNRMEWVRRSIAPITAIAGAILIGIANMRK